MLIPDSIHPENTIFYNGAIVLKALQKYKKISLLDLFSEIKKEYDISFQIYLLSIDWLYLINVAETKEGIVALCS